MSSHKATISWNRNDQPFELKTYSRDHLWQFPGGESLSASAAPAYAGNADLVDPEEAFTASLSACHMLTFLALACSKGFVVNRYEDEAEGTLAKNEQSRLAMTRVVLRPKIEFEGSAPDSATLEVLHERAHKACFIANSVNTEIVVEHGL
jgi:organic hydroperoxide reductase OsmC/OhrA